MYDPRILRQTHARPLTPVSSFLVHTHRFGCGRRRRGGWRETLKPRRALLHAGGVSRSVCGRHGHACRATLRFRRGGAAQALRMAQRRAAGHLTRCHTRVVRSRRGTPTCLRPGPPWRGLARCCTCRTLETAGTAVTARPAPNTDTANHISHMGFLAASPCSRLYHRETVCPKQLKTCASRTCAAHAGKET